MQMNAKLSFASMRIAHIVQCLGMGGQERLILTLSRALAARGHEPVVISLTTGGELRAEFGPIPVIDAPRQHGIDVAVIARIAVALKRLAPDVVHTHNPAPMFYGILAARGVGIARTVHTKHGANRYGARALLAARLVARSIDAFVAVSEGTAAVARTKERVSPGRLHVIPNGIPLSEFGPDPVARAQIRASLNLPESAFVIGTVGRLAPEKDQRLLVRAAAPLLGEQVRLVIVGGGPERANIEREILPEHKPYVTLTGPRADVAQLLAAMDLFALTSRSEGLPLVIPEAMATALPIVATAVGGLPSIVPPSVGRLAPSGDAPALTRAIAEFASDRAQTAAMGESARAMAIARFSLTSMVDAYETLYASSSIR